MTETTVGADLLETLEILAELRVDAVGQDLRVLAVHNVALTIEEPGGDLVLRGVLDDGDDSLELFGRQLTGAVFGSPVSLRFNATPGTLPYSYRLFKSTSAFLQTKLEYLLPTPLILVRAYMTYEVAPVSPPCPSRKGLCAKCRTFCLPSTLVLSRRKMNWKFDFSPDTSDMMGNRGVRCRQCRFLLW